MAEKEKLPGVRGKHLHNPHKDGSVHFTLRGGPAKDLGVRLYPASGGWEKLVIDSHVYQAPPTEDQDVSKPYLIWKGEQ